MKSPAAKLSFKELPKTYSGLVQWHMPRRLHDEADYRNAVEIVDCLAGHDLNPDQEDYLDLLSDLVETYETPPFIISSAKPRQSAEWSPRATA